MGFQSPKTNEDLDLIEMYWRVKARTCFWSFRRYMRPTMKIGWWQREVARELQTFYNELIAGDRPITLIQAPPQHGKSWQAVDFVAWLAGRDPDLRTIYSSFSERLGVRANLMLQRMYDSSKYQAIFPETRISARNAVTVSGQTLRNREILEYVGREGYFRNTTVRGSITGEGLDLSLIDDPIKGREEANSVTVRNKTWDWMTDDMMTRMSDEAGILGIMTRWHIDDPFGRLIKEMGSKVKVLRYPAIAERDEAHRRKGEALFPEHKSLEFLLERKTAMKANPASWESLYQQNPIIVGGDMFKAEWWQYLDVAPPIEWRAIYADTAQKTGQQNDYSVFQCWGKSRNGQAVLLDMLRGKFEAPELLERARAFWAKHNAIQGQGTLRAFKIEDKSSGTGLIQQLKRQGIPVIGIPREKDKITRAYDVAPYVASEQVILLRSAPNLSDFLAEAEAFPNGAHDDTLDPMMDAVSDMFQPRGSGFFLGL